MGRHTDRPASRTRPEVAHDDVVAVRELPPVPSSGTRPAVRPARGVDDAPHRTAPARRPAAVRQPRAGRRRGTLVAATGLLVVLSSAYGVAGTAEPVTDTVTDTAASVRSSSDHGLRVGHGTDRGNGQRARASSAAAAPPAQSPSVAPTAEEETAGTTSSAAPVSSPVPPAPTVPAPAAPVATSLVPAGTWLSGASGDGVADGSFAAWRGSAVTIAGTWADNNEAMTELWQLDSGEEFGSWDQALDIAIGAIGDDESWEQAAEGAYDARWRESLTNLEGKWGSRTAPLFIRFAHEMNGNWYPWSVDAGNQEAFVAAWKRFRALQQEIFPAARLVFSLNRESVGSGFDWRQSFPGAQYVDVIGVDYYNQYPYVASAADWTASLDDVDQYGAPEGLQQHLDFARSVGLPLAVPEWSGHAANGDSAAWIQGMHDFFARNAGGGPGQLLYEVQFNIDMHDDSYRLYPSTRMPQSAAVYQQLF